MSNKGTRRRALLPLVMIVLGTTPHLGCDSFVEGVEDPIHLIADSAMTDARVGLLVNGVNWQFSLIYGRIAVWAGLLSDELIYDSQNANTANSNHVHIDQGLIPLDNLFTFQLCSYMGSLREQSDDLIKRANSIDFSHTELKRQALFAGYFYGGIARYFIASYSGLNPHEGGGVITVDPDDPGPFIGSEEMYGLALARLDSARTFATASELRVVNTITARIYQLKGDLETAREAASGGIASNDDPFVARYSADYRNRFYSESGPGGQPFVFDSLYKAFVDADPAEENRIPLAAIFASDNSTAVYYQNRYTEWTSPLPFATWQENELILAEIELRTGSPTSALNRVNTVRGSWGIGPLDAIDLVVLEDERRKELWGTGLRLLDQRRFDSWHLGPQTWQYFPIPQIERDLNPNL